MASSGGKSKAPAAPAPAATLITDTSDVAMAAADEQRRRLKKSGYSGTLLSGILSNAQAKSSSLLGT